MLTKKNLHIKSLLHLLNNLVCFVFRNFILRKQFIDGAQKNLIFSKNWPCHGCFTKTPATCHRFATRQEKKERKLSRW